MKIDPAAIATTALRLLNEVGLDGLTMRLVARELGVQAPALYWHVKNKQELLDAMANVLYEQAVVSLQPPRRDTDWRDWVRDLAHRTRATMLRHRDGARVLAGTHTTTPVLGPSIELTIRTFLDAGFSEAEAVRGFTTIYHYTVGFTIEEQARQGHAYGPDNPYQSDRFAAALDTDRHPLLGRVLDDVFPADPDAAFDDGLTLILTGISPPAPDTAGSPTVPA